MHRFSLPLIVVATAVLLLAAPRANAQEEDLAVVADWFLYSDADNALYQHLAGDAYDHLERRKQHVDRLQTRAQWEERQQRIRQQLLEAVGPFPEKTPLKAQVLRTIDKPNYSVEHLIYYSRPTLPVTASLFLPDDLEEKAPAILFCTGHSQAAYARSVYQQVILNLVEKGFIVLAFDPVSQGERVQYLDPETGESQIGSSVAEHSYAGAQAFLIGRSQARHMIWDGIRGIDYLLTREEVDSERIGVHGLSGGGTQSAYIGALDERTAAAAPANYISGLRRLLESVGPQDGEQNLYHELALGIDHADFFTVRAPRPSLIAATTRDFISIQGARETHAEAKRAYAAFGVPENMEIVEDDHEHGYTEKTREGIYAFFQKHLENPGSSEDLEVDYLTPAEMQITSTGQLQSSEFEGETLFDINRREAQSKLSTLRQSREESPTHLTDVRKAAENLSGYRQPEARSEEPVFRGRYPRNGYVVEKYFIQGEGEYPIPYLLMIPDEGAQGKAVLYLHSEGKAADAAPGGDMERLVRQGYAVLAPDLLGIGEMGPVPARWTVHGVPYSHWFLAVLSGRSIAGLHAGDIVRLANVLEQQASVDARRVSAIAYDDLSPALLHAAALDASFSDVALVNPLISYQSLVTTELYDPEHIMGAVAGALPSYDLPDLAASLAPDRLLILNPLDAAGQSAAASSIDEAYSVVRRSYERADAADRLAVRASSTQAAADVIASWLD